MAINRKRARDLKRGDVVLHNDGSLCGTIKKIKITKDAFGIHDVKVTYAEGGTGQWADGPDVPSGVPVQ